MSKAGRPPAGSGTRGAAVRATRNGVLLAETTRRVLLEGHVYFPPDDARREHLAATRHRPVCAWKGVARYYTVRAGGQQNTNAAWYCPHPSPLAHQIRNHVAFWPGVQVHTGRRHRPRRCRKRGPGRCRTLAPRPQRPQARGAEPCSPDV
jgi:uncharacterized protein (DUF427 family)